jgi:hypothetical protein
VSQCCLDAFVLSVVGLTMFLALGLFWAPLRMAAAIYYFGSILALGSTPGCCIFAAAAAAIRVDRRVGTWRGRRHQASPRTAARLGTEGRAVRENIPLRG